MRLAKLTTMHLILYLKYIFSLLYSRLYNINSFYSHLKTLIGFLKTYITQCFAEKWEKTGRKRSCSRVYVSYSTEVELIKIQQKKKKTIDEVVKKGEEEEESKKIRKRKSRKKRRETDERAGVH